MFFDYTWKKKVGDKDNTRTNNNIKQLDGSETP
jgi:hypothetical protein